MSTSPSPRKSRHSTASREHHRLLGNGYCTRPPELDCAFESICETCTCLQDGAELHAGLEEGAGLATPLHRDDLGPPPPPLHPPFHPNRASTPPPPTTPAPPPPPP